MSFRESLEGICSRVEGALGAVVVAEDGIIVERHAVNETLDLELACVEIAGAAREVKKATESVEAGELEELLVANERWLTLLRRAGPGYWLLLLMTPEGLLGRGRYELRRAAHELAAEFA